MEEHPENRDSRIVGYALVRLNQKSEIFELRRIAIDVTLGMACFFGVGAVMTAFPLLEKAILLVGSVIVIWIGQGLVRAHDTMDTSTKVDIPILKVISTACVVTWFNPQALIDGTMMLGAFKATLPEGMDFFFVRSSSSTVSSCFGASFKW